MKTYEEILNDVIEYHFKNVTFISPVDIKKEAAKEYAKQWVAQVVKEMSDSPHENDSMITYYHLAIDAQ